MTSKSSRTAAVARQRLSADLDQYAFIFSRMVQTLLSIPHLFYNIMGDLKEENANFPHCFHFFHILEASGHFCIALSGTKSDIMYKLQDISSGRILSMEEERKPPADGSRESGAHPFPAGAERLPAHRPLQGALRSISARRRNSAASATCAWTTPTPPRKTPSTSMPSRTISTGSASTGATASSTARIILKIRTTSPSSSSKRVSPTSAS